MEMKSSDWLIIVIIILLFVGAVVGVGYHTVWLISLCVGLLITIISGVVLRLELQKEKKKLIAPVSALVIGIVVVVTGLVQWMNPQLLDHILHDNGNYFGKLFLFVIGILMVILPFAGRMRRKRCCTEAVEATCVERVKVRGARMFVYRCTYEFQFEGKQQTIALVDQLDLFSKMKVGHEMTIWIDPKYQDEYYIPFDRNDLSVFVMILGTMLAISVLAYGNSL